MTAGRLELYGSRACGHTTDLREHLEWRNVPFVEYDVETDTEARRRLQELTPGPLAVPVLVENGIVTTVGWRGRSCFVTGLRVHQPDKA
jgi:glutaredoxin